MTVPAYPLQWPEGWKRTPPALRKAAKFTKQKVEYREWRDAAGQSHSNRIALKQGLSINDAIQRVRAEVRTMTGDDDFVLNSDLELRLDGLPRSGQREPQDPGVVIYWVDRNAPGKPQRCMAIDIYDRVADNIAAIAATLEAMRAIERHGGAEILNRAFTGFVALEDRSSESWYAVLGVAQDASREDIKAAYRRLVAQHHPDRGGDSEQFQRVQRAYEEATK